MKKICGLFTVALMLCLVFGLSNGCRAFRRSVSDVDLNDKADLTAKYDRYDLRSMTDEIAEKLLAHGFLAEESQPPITVVLGVENRTTEHIDTRALTEALRE